MMHVPQLKVTTAPMLDPGDLRTEISVPAGMTVAEILAVALPGASAEALDRTRVWLVTRRGQELVNPAVWHRAKPRAGVHIVIRLLPGKGALGSILQILVTVATAFIAGPLALAIGGPLGITGGLGLKLLTGAVGLGLNLAGGLLISALFPTQQPSTTKEKPTYAFNGWNNRLALNEPIPRHHGRVRFAPPFAVRSYIAIVGNDMYIYAVVLWGHGPINLSDLKLGDTPLSKYGDAVQIEHRYGFADDEPLTLVTEQVIEDAKSLGVELTRPLPRDDEGEPTGGDAIETPVARMSATDCTKRSVIFHFPEGLVRFNDDGDEVRISVTIRIRERINGAGDWTDVATLTFREKERRPFYRQHTWEGETRGLYEVECTMMNSETTGTQTFRRVDWIALQSFRPEYPINTTKPMALSALCMKATNTLNGTVDTLNGVVDTIAPDYDLGEDEEDPASWTENDTAWPPSQAILALKGRASAFPVEDSAIDWPAFADWHEFCVDKGLKYNRTHDFREPLRNTLKAIGAAGRAVIRFDGQKWTVIIDRPRDAPISLISARNASQMKWRNELIRTPDAFRVPFRDETNFWGNAEMIVPFPDHEGAVVETEKLDRPWITNPEQLFYDVTRYQYELLHRSANFTAVQDGMVRTATSGDFVIASRDLLSRGVHSARVKSVDGDQVEINDFFKLAEGETYAIRFKLYTELDTIGATVLRTIETVEGEQRIVTLSGTGDAPAVDSIVQLVKTTGSTDNGRELIVVGVERGRNNSSVLTMKPAAPEIDALTEAREMIVWNGRVGAILPPSAAAPAVPIITRIETGLVSTGDPDGLSVFLRPGGAGAATATFRVEHRLEGETDWVGPLSCPVAEGAIDIDGYTAGDIVELRAWAMSSAGVPGDKTAIITKTVGSDDVAGIPSLDFSKPANSQYLGLF